MGEIHKVKLCEYDQLIENITNGLIVNILGCDPYDRLNKAWSALSDKVRRERIEECQEFLDVCLEQGRGTLMDAWRK